MVPIATIFTPLSLASFAYNTVSRFIVDLPLVMRMTMLSTPGRSPFSGRKTTWFIRYSPPDVFLLFPLRNGKLSILCKIRSTEFSSFNLSLTYALVEKRTTAIRKLPLLILIPEITSFTNVLTIFHLLWTCLVIALGAVN